MTFEGTGRRLTPADLDDAAVLIGTDAATIAAVLEVESAGRGFGPGHRPLILFEPHIFWRRLREAGPLPLQARAVASGLAYPRWGTRPYPRHQADRYDQLEAACAIHTRVALESTSWGLGQLMGFNWARCGYDSVHALVEGAKLSEREQLLGMVRFIVNRGLAGPLAAHAWAAFADGYNGPQSAVHRYDARLAAAYARHASGDRHA